MRTGNGDLQPYSISHTRLFTMGERNFGDTQSIPCDARWIARFKAFLMRRKRAAGPTANYLSPLFVHVDKIGRAADSQADWQISAVRRSTISRYVAEILELIDQIARQYPGVLRIA